jgi:hypothetical protein
MFIADSPLRFDGHERTVERMMEAGDFIRGALKHMQNVSEGRRQSRQKTARAYRRRNPRSSDLISASAAKKSL